MLRRSNILLFLILLMAPSCWADGEQIRLGRSGIVTVYVKRETFWDTDSTCGRITYWKVSFVVDKTTELKYQILNKTDTAKCQPRADDGYVFEVLPSKPYVAEVTTFNGARPIVAIGTQKLSIPASGASAADDGGPTRQPSIGSELVGTWVDYSTRGAISRLKILSDGTFVMSEPAIKSEKTGVYSVLTPTQIQLPFATLLRKGDKLFSIHDLKEPRFVKLP